jgi:putative two-component system response regulator
MEEGETASPPRGSDGIHGMRILAVDDQRPNVVLLERLLATWGFTQVRTTTDSKQVLELVDGWSPDLLLLDLQMPAPDGFELMAALGDGAGAARLPILVLTADITVETRRRALSTGASDFVSKPFDLDEVRLRVGNLLETRRLQAELTQYAELLEARVRQRTRDLEQSRLEVLERLALAAEYRDDDTYRHTERVGRATAVLARRLGLSAEEAGLLRRAAPLHDIGKVAVPDSILLKPGRLTVDEFEVMKEHATAGARILGGSASPLLQMAEVIARSHHERWDGTGYPAGLAGEAIPLHGRLVALTDVFDALTHARPYKEAMPVQEALREMDRMTGTHFDPRIKAAFDELDHLALAGT